VWIALLAAVAMVLSDLIAVPLVQAEARDKAHLAGMLDTAGWLVTITTTFLSVNALQGHSFSTKVWVVTLVSGANYIGTLTGTKLGKRWIKDDETTVASRLTRLEQQIGIHS
jgi:hypothetical protein